MVVSPPHMGPGRIQGGHSRSGTQPRTYGIQNRQELSVPPKVRQNEGGVWWQVVGSNVHNVGWGEYRQVALPSSSFFLSCLGRGSGVEGNFPCLKPQNSFSP